MDIKEQLTILSEICRQDQKIIGGRERLARLNRDSSQAQGAARDLAAAIASIKNSKEELLKKRRELDDRLQHEKSNLRKWETRAEKIKGEREYTALMSEIGSLRRTITGIELEISEVSNELKSSDEKLLSTSGAHEEKLNVASSSLDSVRELLDEEEKRLKGEQDVRLSLLNSLPQTLRRQYERIYEKRSQQGVAFLRDGVCQACMRMVPPELFNRVSKGEVIELCPSCQRFLVADQDVVKENQR